VRTSAESTPYKGATSPIPLEPLLLLLLLLLLYTTGRFPRQAHFSTLKMEAAAPLPAALVPVYQTTRRHIRHTVRTARNTPCATLNS